MSFIDGNSYILNFGPHHPSTHGVLRLILHMSGERVLSCNPDIGYLHRGVERMCEDLKFLSIIPVLDRVDYLAPLHMEHAYILAIEEILKIIPPERALYIRTIFDELMRISSHLMGIGSGTYDMGCLSLLLYSIEEREKIMKIFEMTTGARMHLTYYIPGGVFQNVSRETFFQIREFLDGMKNYLDIVEKLALDNRIFKKRTQGIGIISKDMAIKYGITGANARASGLEYDIRKIFPYAMYNNIQFDTILLNEGDCYARIFIRYLEIKQSISIIKQCINQIPDDDNISSYSVLSLISNKEKINNKFQELLYTNFFVSGMSIPSNSMSYKSVESSRGELGIYVYVDDENEFKPSRLRVRSPSFAIIQMLQELLIGEDFANVTSILGSLDFIMGDCDR